jgi:hypothetical protein
MIIYKGGSLINGESIVGILTFGSNNKKTGNMIQAWVIPEKNPNKNKDADIAVCGDCPLRMGTCYVNKAFSVGGVYKKYKRGGYPEFDKRFLRNETLRITAWGDPAAIPFEVWKNLAKRVTMSTGYTHQWKTCDQRMQRLVMASTETVTDTLLAQSMGWKTFRIKSANAPLLPSEIICPYTTGDILNCKSCGICDGIKSNVVVNVHGLGYKITMFNEMFGTAGHQR